MIYPQMAQIHADDSKRFFGFNLRPSAPSADKFLVQAIVFVRAFCAFRG
ncbi:MAG TPA: hypothetical protein VJ001_08765 [Rhodocyclaceae bacterium]|nr:hypothetical protein [Rhodocyclaceae bacterium]